MESNIIKQVQVPKEEQKDQQKQANKKESSKMVHHETLASFVYFSLSNSQPFKKYVKDIKEEIKQIMEKYGFYLEPSENKLNLKLQEQHDKDLHISLSRSFNLYMGDKEILLAQLKKQLKTHIGNSIMLPISFKGIRIIDHKFIVLEIDEGIFIQKLKSITKVIDNVLGMWKFDPYFDQPIFHATLYKIQIQNNGNEKDQDEKKMLQRIFDELQCLKLKKKCFNAKELCLKFGNKVNKLI